MENNMSSYLKLIHIDIWAFVGSMPGLKLSLASPNKAWAWAWPVGPSYEQVWWLLAAIIIILLFSASII